MTALAEKFAALGEWTTRFRIGGETLGGSYVAEGDDRLTLFLAEMKARGLAPRSVLECGCLEGGHTVQLSRAFPEAGIVATDVRANNLEKTRLVIDALACRNVELVQDDLDDPATVFARAYDAIFCVGLLYHLRRPAHFLSAACRSAPVLWLWTVYCAEDAAALQEGAYRGKIWHEPTAHMLSAVRDESFFPTLGSLLDMLWQAGYLKIHLIRKEMTANGSGPAILLCAAR